MTNCHPDSLQEEEERSVNINIKEKGFQAVTAPAEEFSLNKGFF